MRGCRSVTPTYSVICARAYQPWEWLGWHAELSQTVEQEAERCPEARPLMRVSSSCRPRVAALFYGVQRSVARLLMPCCYEHPSHSLSTDRPSGAVEPHRD